MSSFPLGKESEGEEEEEWRIRRSLGDLELILSSVEFSSSIWDLLRGRAGLFFF